MLKTLPQRLLIGSLSFAFFFGSAIFLALVTQYKPWGVPDVRRAEYEAKLTNIRNRNAKIDEYQNKARPQCRIPNSAHDFGFVAEGQELSHVFKIENIGQESLEVLSTSVPRNVVLNVHEQPISPGSASSVMVNWRPSDADLINEEGQAGKPFFNRTITVITNDPIDPSFTLSLTAKPKQTFLYPKELIFDPCSPGDSISHSFYLSSQVLNEISVDSIDCDAPGFFVDHEPLRDLTEVGDPSVTAAHRFFVRVIPIEYGKFSTSIKMLVNANDESHELTVDFSGRVKTPITFNHPEMHRTLGLDLGTLSAGKQHQFHVQVRLRGEEHRKLELLDWKPQELQATMTPQKLKGAYKLTITVPKDCPTTLFNRNDHRGYVEVGDPKDPGFCNWLPFYGAVANLGSTSPSR